MDTDLGIPDPQWELTLAIRAALDRTSRYVTDVDTRHAQAVVDLHWAARQAGRLLGMKIKVELGAYHGEDHSFVTATVLGVQVNPTERARAADGLGRLLKSVRAVQQEATCTPAGMPRPRGPQRERVRTLALN
jgi:hypothetical protein